MLPPNSLSMLCHWFQPIKTLEMQCGAFYKSHLFCYLFRLSLMQQMPSAQPKCNTKYRIANKLKTGSPLYPRLCACVECVLFFPTRRAHSGSTAQGSAANAGTELCSGSALVEPVPSVVGISTQR